MEWAERSDPGSLAMMHSLALSGSGLVVQFTLGWWLPLGNVQFLIPNEAYMMLVGGLQFIMSNVLADVSHTNLLKNTGPNSILGMELVGR